LDIFNPKQSMTEWLKETLADIVNAFATSAMKNATEYIANFADFSKVPHFDDLMNLFQSLGFSLLGIFLVIRLAEAWKVYAEGESPNWAGIIGAAVVAAFLIPATPYLVKSMAIPACNAIMKSLALVGFKINTVSSSAPEYIQNDWFTNLSKASWDILALSLFWAIGFVVLTIAGAIRFVELTIAMLAAPIAGAAYLKNPSVYGMYWREVVAILFTQVIQLLLMYLMVASGINGSWLSIAYSIACIIVALRGPAIFRQFLYATGTGAGMVGVSRMAAYRLMVSKTFLNKGGTQ
jgi:hypothetical protein